MILITTNNKTIGVTRNPYERVVSLYMLSLEYVGLDKWIDKHKPIMQTEMFEKCDYLIRFENWEQELLDLEVEVIDKSEVEKSIEMYDWKGWYTLNTRSHVAELYHNDIITYGYSY